MCVCGENTVVKDEKPWPGIMGIVFNVKDGSLHPASWNNRGPEAVLRSARVFAGDPHVYDVYDSSSQKLSIHPFETESQNEYLMYLTLTDDKIRQFFSTSPDQEPDHFVKNVRESFQLLSSGADLFPSKEPLVYVFRESRWTREH